MCCVTISIDAYLQKHRLAYLKSCYIQKLLLFSGLNALSEGSHTEGMG